MISFLVLLFYSFTFSAASPVIQDDAQNSTTSSQFPIAGFIAKIWPAVIAMILYGISCAIHWTHFFRIGQRYMLTLTIGMTCLTLGMVMRIAVSKLPYSIGVYIVEDFLIVLSPCAFLATDYMIFSRLADSLGQDIADDCLLIPSRRITKIFVWSDVITFLIQGNGAGLTIQSNLAKIGTAIVLTGLILQLLSFGLFTTMLIAFGFKVRSKYPRSWNISSSSESLGSVVGLFKITYTSNWKILYFTLCLTCVGILIRSFFRIAEFAEGYTGFLSTHEGYFYLLDALPLWISMTLYCFVWPTRFINRQELEDANRDTSVGLSLVQNGKYLDRH